MKRMQLIAAALCLIMITMIGAGVVAAKQTENPRQAGSSPVYLFDVKATDTHGAGKLMINLAEHKFIFNGKDFDPDKTLYLQYRIGNLQGIHTFASATATPSGNIHIEGTWIQDIAALPAPPTFSVGETSLLYPALHWTSYPVVYINGHPYAPLAFNAAGSIGPIVGYRLLLVVEGQYDNYEAYWGPSVNLNDHGAAWSDKINIDTAASYAYAELVVWDSDRNTAYDVHDIMHEPSG